MNKLTHTYTLIKDPQQLLTRPNKLNCVYKKLLIAYFSTKSSDSFRELSSLPAFSDLGKGRVRKYRIHAGSRQQTTNQNSADETIGRRVVVECLSRRLALSRKPLTPNIPYCCYLFVAASRWPFGETTAESQDDDGSDGSRPHTDGANAAVPYPDDDRARHRSCSRPAVHVRCMRQHSPQSHVPQTRRRVGDVRQKGH